MTVKEKLVNAEHLLNALFSDDCRPSLRWLRTQTKAKTIPHVRIGNLVFFDVETHRDRSSINPRSVLHSVRAFEARYVPVVWEPSVEKAAERVESWTYWFARELSRSAISISTASNTL